MIKNRRWFAFFSHTGTEIYRLYRRTGIKPEKVITNLPPGDERINKDLRKLKTEFVYVADRPTVEDYRRILSRCGGCLCTLHGWMRIIPKSICEEYEFYNLHPGLISKYPELKGKDPQARVDPEIHDRIGLVIHRVTAGVDEGPKVAESSCHNVYNSESCITKRLKDMAVDTWVDVADMLSARWEKYKDE